MNKSELFTRTLTGIFIVGITLAAVIYSPHTYVLLLIFITQFGAREFLQLEKITGNRILILSVPVILAFSVGLTGEFILSFQNPIFIIAAFPFMVSCILLLLIISLPSPSELSSSGRSYFTTCIYIGLPMISGCLFLLPEYSFPYVLVPILLIWANDVFAYLAGSLWGTKKIMPLISPGKSLQGTIGGGIITVLLSFLLMRIWPALPMGYVLTLGLATPLFALGGDLWESALKRNTGVKDSGNIFPGHGGVLDRYDSLLFVMPVAALAYFIFVL